MADLRRHLTELGCTDVRTYIQSGNVVLTPPTATGPIDAWLSARIGELAGYAVPTVTRTARELRGVIDGNPYPTSSGTQLHVVFFGGAPPRSLVEALDLEALAPEECTLVGRDLYLHLPNGMGRAVLPVALEKAGRKLKVPPGTARNWNTVVKLQEMLGE